MNAMHTAEELDTVRAVALEATNKSYAPYTGWGVGSGGLTSEKELVRGCNIESGSFPVTMCAESTLVGNLVIGASGRLTLICCRLHDGSYLPPCGRCRQLLVEHGGLELEIVLGPGPDDVVTLADLLPHPYLGEALRLPPGAPTRATPDEVVRT